MSILKLRDEDSVPEPDKEVVLPERPPGLDAIQAWMRKRRPWLRGIKLWIKHILSAGPAAREWLRVHGPRAKRRLRRLLRWIADRSAPATRPLAQVGEILRELGKRIRRDADGLRDLLAKQTPAGTQSGDVGRIALSAGGLIVSSARLSGSALIVLGDLLALFTKLTTPPVPAPPPEPPEPPPKPDPSPPEGPKPDEGSTEEEPGPQLDPDPSSGSTDQAATGSATPGPAPQPPGKGTPEPIPTPDPDPNPDPTPEPDPDPRPDRTPDPTPDSSPSTPAPTRAEPASAVPSEADIEARLEGLPPVVRYRVLALKGWTHRDVLHPLILDICLLRDWSTPKQLARWLDMNRPSLSERHLGPLVRDGLLELKYPDRRRSPRQAYRTCRDRWPPRR